MKCMNALETEKPAGFPAGRVVVAVICLAASSLISAGCAHGRHRGDHVPSAWSASRWEIPWILTNPACLLLTHTDGFIAHVVLTQNGASETNSSTLSGELFCLQERLYLLPEVTGVSRGKARGGLSFIWDIRKNSGFALSEALQGYAPIGSWLHYTNVATAADLRIPSSEKLEGHLCVIERVTVGSTGGNTNVFEVWRAPDLRNVPLKIASVTGDTPFTVRLSTVRLELPPPEVFATPAGFTAYPSLESMLNELAQREQEMRHRPEGAHRENDLEQQYERGRRR
jgi:hypothetical protein